MKDPASKCNVHPVSRYLLNTYYLSGALLGLGFFSREKKKSDSVLTLRLLTLYQASCIYAVIIKCENTAVIEIQLPQDHIRRIRSLHWR